MQIRRSICRCPPVGANGNDADAARGAAAFLCPFIVSFASIEATMQGCETLPRIINYAREPHFQWGVTINWKALEK